MNLSTAVEKANAVTTEKQAARLYNNLEAELALGGGGSEESYEQGEEALRILARRFPGIDQAAHEVTQPPQLSNRAKRNMDEPPREEPHERRAHSRRPAGSARRRPAPRPAPARHSPARQVVSTAGDALDWAGDTGWGDLIGSIFLSGVGLSIFYLLLTHDTAVSKLGLGATNIARAVISPHIDPLNPGRSL